KKVFIRSGIRYDYLLEDKKADKYIEELCQHHVSGLLKVAPEHSSKIVLSAMHKAPKEAFIKFVEKFKSANEKLGMKQFLIPYLMSSHPGSDIDEAINLALLLKETGYSPDQIQDFYPTPGTLSTCMYYSGIDPISGREIYVPKGLKEKRKQKALIHFKKPENRDIIKQIFLSRNRMEDYKKLMK
ncbi:MAG: DUF3362 domain-containing protein, partial [Anaerovoracaceae bacterium]